MNCSVSNPNLDAGRCIASGIPFLPRRACQKFDFWNEQRAFISMFRPSSSTWEENGHLQWKRAIRFGIFEMKAWNEVGNHTSLIGMPKMSRCESSFIEAWLERRSRNGDFMLKMLYAIYHQLGKTNYWWPEQASNYRRKEKLCGKCEDRLEASPLPLPPPPSSSFLYLRDPTQVAAPAPIGPVMSRLAITAENDRLKLCDLSSN